MKFKFGLETLMKHRKSLEDMARRDFYDAKEKSDDLLSDINRLYNSNDEVRGFSHQLSDKPEYVVFQQLSHEYLEGNKIRIERKKNEFRDALAVTESKHESLVEAAKEAKVLEKLKEKKFNEFKEAVRKKERKDTDEIVVQRTSRRIPE